MDFIERLFGMAPDGGNGALEFLLFALPIAGIVFSYVRRRPRQRSPVGGAAERQTIRTGERGR